MSNVGNNVEAGNPIQEIADQWAILRMGLDLSVHKTVCNMVIMTENVADLEVGVDIDMTEMRVNLEKIYQMMIRQVDVVIIVKVEKKEKRNTPTVMITAGAGKIGNMEEGGEGLDLARMKDHELNQVAIIVTIEAEIMTNHHVKENHRHEETGVVGSKREIIQEAAAGAEAIVEIEVIAPITAGINLGLPKEIISLFDKNNVRLSVK